MRVGGFFFAAVFSDFRKVMLYLNFRFYIRFSYLNKYFNAFFCGSKQGSFILMVMTKCFHFDVERSP